MPKSHELAQIDLQEVPQATIIAAIGSFEPPHDKTNKMSVRPVKTQIILGIRHV